MPTMLGLRVPTDPRWVALAVANLDAVLIDHAHCELKAAANAVALLGRWPDDMHLVEALGALAEEELSHFRQVCERLTARGLTLGTPSKDEYAVLLRRAAAQLPRRHDEHWVSVDRLLVGALIEARSAERFGLLAEALGHDPSHHELHLFYKELFACEARHYRTYTDLAEHLLTRRCSPAEARAQIRERLDALTELEGQLVSDSAHHEVRAAIHG